MPSKKHKPEEIIGKLREAEIVVAQGGTTPEACRRIGVSEQTYYLYGRLSLCKLISKRSAWISCKHLSGVSWFPRAPKWGIRTRAPLQLDASKNRLISA